MERPVRWFVTRFALGVLVTIVLTSGAVTQAGPVSSGTLVYGLRADAATFDAPRAQGPSDFTPINQIYERLVLIDYDGSLKPQLAESWQGSSDLLRWTFKLRRGVKFHDGTPFNAEAVKASYDRVMSPETSLLARQFQSGIDKVEIVDDSTVIFHSKGPNASFVYQFVGEMRPVIHSPSAIQKWGREYNAHPVGTGPFRFVEWRRDEQIILDRNPDYWGEKPKINRLMFKIVPDAQTMLIEVEKGTVHITQSPFFPVEQLGQIRRNPNLVVGQDVQYQVFGYWFNTRKEPFTDVQVRKALRLAVDTDTIVKTIGAGLMERARGPVYIKSVAVHPSLQEPLYDVDQAKRILASRGWQPGPTGILQRDNRPFAFTILATSGIIPKDKDITEAVQRYFRAVGVDARIETLELGAFLAQRERAAHDVTWMAIGPRPPDPALTALDIALACTGNLNHSYYCSAELDAILARAKSAKDLSQRKQFYYVAQEKVWEEYPGIYVSNPYFFIVQRKEVKGFRPTTSRFSNLFNSTSLAP